MDLFKFCPLRGNKEVDAELNKVSEAINDDAATLAWVENHGNGIDKAPNGADSILFSKIKDRVKDETTAIRLKFSIYTARFKKMFGDWNNNPTNATKILCDENGEPSASFILSKIAKETAVAGFLNRLLPARTFNQVSNMIHTTRLYPSGYILTEVLERPDEYEPISRKYIGLLAAILRSDIDHVKVHSYIDHMNTHDALYNYIHNDLKTDLQQNINELQLKIDELLLLPSLQTLKHDTINWLNNKGWEHPDDYSLQFANTMKTVFRDLFDEFAAGNKSRARKSAVLKKADLQGKILTPFAKNFNTRVARLNAALQHFAINQNMVYGLNTRIKSLKEELLALDTIPDIEDRIINKVMNCYDIIKKYWEGPTVSKTESPLTFISANGKSAAANKVLPILLSYAKDKDVRDFIGFLNKNIDDKYQIILDTGDFLPDYYEDYVFLPSSSENINSQIVSAAFIKVMSDYANQHEQEYNKVINAMSGAGVPSSILKGDHTARMPISEPFEILAKDKIRFFQFVTDNKKYLNVINKYPVLASFIKNALGIKRAGYSQFIDKVFSKIDGAQYDYVPEYKQKLRERRSRAYDHIKNVRTLEDADESEIKLIEDQDDLLKAWIVNLSDDELQFVSDYVKLRISENTTSSLSNIVRRGRKAWIEDRLKSIMQSTQTMLAEAYHIHKDAYGRWVGDNDLVVRFVENLDGPKGYYDYNATARATYHVISIALNQADPSTFNHELAHHYVRIFWNSKLIQTALAAVSKPGMSDVDREEALVDVMTAKSLDKSLQDQHAFTKFWDKFATMLYRNFHISNAVIKNGVMNNITRAFMLNEKQQLLEDSQTLYDMYPGRVYQRRKTYKEKLQQMRDQRKADNASVDYKAIGGDKVLSAINTIIKGTVARNKSYRHDYTDPLSLAKMLLQENEVREFAQLVSEIRDAEQLRLKQASKTFRKSDISHSTKEQKANVKLIKSFLENAAQEIQDGVDKLRSVQANNYAFYNVKENVDEKTGDISYEYIDTRDFSDPTVSERKITFKELIETKQNTIGFYLNAITAISKAIEDPKFVSEYGQKAKDEISQTIHDSIGTIGLLSQIRTLDSLYQNAITERLIRFSDGYIKENVDLPDVYKTRMMYNVKTWLEDQNTFGDVTWYESFIGLAGLSKSLLVRMLQDIIDDMSIDINLKVQEKGMHLRSLRLKAQKRLNVLGIPYRNIDKLLLETDKHGYTGNFATEINSGEFYNQRSEFMDNLLYGKDGVQDKLRKIVGDDFLLEIDEDGYPIIPLGDDCDAIEKWYSKEINHWMSQRGDRPYTVEYYDKRTELLSQGTRKAVAKIQDRINRILKAARLPDGTYDTSVLPSDKMDELNRLYRQRSYLSSPYDSYGREKQVGTEEYKIYKELTEWHKYTQDKIVFTTNHDAYELAKSHAKNKEAFDRYNTYEETNPEIWKYFVGDESRSEELNELYEKRRKLVSLIKGLGLTWPNILIVYDDKNGRIKPQYEDFWANIKKLDEEIEKTQEERADWSDQKRIEYRKYMGSVSNPYNGQFEKTDMSWYRHIEKQVSDRLYAQNQHDPNIREKIAKEMERFSIEYTDRKTGQKKRKLLSIFRMSAPNNPDFVTLGGQKIPSIITVPVLIYSSLDLKLSDKSVVNEHYDLSNPEYFLLYEDKDVETRKNVTISYTNHKYTDSKAFQDPDVKAYRDALVETMRESYESLPFVGKYDQRLPLIGASTSQLILRRSFWRDGPKRFPKWLWPLMGGIGAGTAAVTGGMSLLPAALVTAGGADIGGLIPGIFYYLKRTYGMPNESDVDINTDYSTNPDGSRAMSIPIRFIKRLDDESRINTDILGGVMKFYQMSLNYNTKIKKLPIFRAFLDKLESNQTKDRVRQREVIKNMINQQFYDRRSRIDMNEDNPAVVKKRWERWILKFLPAFKRVAQTGLLALGWIPGLVSFLDPEISMIVDALRGKYISKADLAYGISRALINAGPAIAGLNATRAYGKIPAAIRHFKMHNEGAEGFEGMNRPRLFRKSWSDIVMAPFELGEYTLSAQIVGAVMHSYKWYNGKFYNRLQFIKLMLDSGKMTARQADIYFTTKMHTNLFSAYSIDKEGNFKQNDTKYGKAVDAKFDRNLSKLMNDRLLGYGLTMSRLERTRILSNIVLTLIFVVRTFMIPGFIRRFKHQHDFQLEDESLVDDEDRSAEEDRLFLEFAADDGGYSFQTLQIETGITYGAWRALNPFSNGSYYRYWLYRMQHPLKNRYDEDLLSKKQQLGVSDANIYAAKTVLTELAIIAGLSLLSVLWHNKVVSDGDDTYLEDLLDILLFRVTLERLTLHNPGTIMDLVTSITATTSDIDNKLKVIDLVQDFYSAYSQYGWDTSKWDRVKSGNYKDRTKVFADLCKTLASLGLHNAYKSSTKYGLQTMQKYYMQNFWSPMKPFYKKRKTKKSNNSTPKRNKLMI